MIFVVRIFERFEFLGLCHCETWQLSSRGGCGVSGFCVAKMCYECVKIHKFKQTPEIQVKARIFVILSVAKYPKRTKCVKFKATALKVATSNADSKNKVKNEAKRFDPKEKICGANQVSFVGNRVERICNFVFAES